MGQTFPTRLPLSRGEWGSHLIGYDASLAGANLCVKWHLDPSSRFVRVQLCDRQTTDRQNARLADLIGLPKFDGAQ